MELLNFRLNPYVRVQWASKELKDVWEPKIQEVRDSLERNVGMAAVFSGARDCSTIRVMDADLEEFKKELSKEGAFYIPMYKLRNGGGWMGVLSYNMTKAYDFLRAIQDNDEDKRAQYLGIPKCCHEFNMKHRHLPDLTWEYASNASDTLLKKKTDTTIRLKNYCNQYASPFLRKWGINLLPYVPCSPDCEETAKITNKLVAKLKERETAQLSTIFELLSMPVEWNALKGIGYLRTPLFKLEFDTVTCYPTYIVQQEGSIYPEGAPRGLTFPYNELPRKRHIPAGLAGEDEVF